MSSTRQCNHPEVSPLASANLQMFSYLPEPLVKQTRAFIEAEDLLSSQKAARDNFLFLFRLHQDDTYTDVLTLEELAEYLDAFFFAGLLTRGRRRILRCLELEQDILSASRLEPLLFGEWAITISINSNNQDGMPSPLHSLLETLVRELVSSFLKSFICYGESCQAERTAVLDSINHGRPFVDLLESITRVVREWDKDLAAFSLLEDSANV